MTDRMTEATARLLAEMWQETGVAGLAVVLLVAVCVSMFVVKLGVVASGPAALPSCIAADAYPPEDYSCQSDPAPWQASRAVPGFFVSNH